MLGPTAEDVQASRYRNSDKVPEVGDVVIVNGSPVRVAQLGGALKMFVNCTFDDKFVLTDPTQIDLKV